MFSFFVVLFCCCCSFDNFPLSSGSLIKANIPGLVPIYDGRIVGGKPANIEQFPHQISMRYYNSHRCGGSIINELTILSAAHCVEGTLSGALVIRAGTAFKEIPGEDRKVARIIRHERYSRRSLDNDVAILRLVLPFQFSDKIQPVSLVNEREIFPAGTSVVVSGWGATGENKPVSNVLQNVEVKIIDHEECKQAYASKIPITKNMLCAGFIEGGLDSCQGDSGGPLILKVGKSNEITESNNNNNENTDSNNAVTDISVIIDNITEINNNGMENITDSNNNNNDNAVENTNRIISIDYYREDSVINEKALPKLVGVVSWGFGCARPGFPGVYTNLALLRPWITRRMQRFRNRYSKIY